MPPTPLQKVPAKITDGEKEATEANVVLLTRGNQWVQIDLEKPREIYAVVVWHAHNTQKIYHGVVVQIADGPDFTPVQNARTLFNNDVENKSGLGLGTNREYFETNEGKLIAAQGAKARYVRLYSNGRYRSPGTTNTRRWKSMLGRPNDPRGCNLATAPPTTQAAIRL